MQQIPNLFDTELCAKCRGRGFCKKPCKIYLKMGFVPKTKAHFSGDSPPEIFVGRYNYPCIGAGILAPDSGQDMQNIEEFASPEIWHEKKFPIDVILSNRSKLIYSKFQAKVRSGNKFVSLMQEISMAYKPVSTEFFLKKPPLMRLEINKHLPLIGNPAHLQHARLQENPKIRPKVDYIVSDSDSKSAISMIELYKAQIPVSNINKMLSAGLLGLKTQRKLVPTRWSITGVDDILSKYLLKKIRYYPEISEILLFNAEYNGNHYEIILLPDKFSFEVLEAEISGSIWNKTGNVSVMKDYELFSGRKKYAIEVMGAYYANRLGLAEYLEKIKRQATAIFIREVGPEYYAPLGVGILREITRAAFQKAEKFNTIEDALAKAQSRLRVPISTWTDKSVLLKEFGKQKRLSNWIS